MNQIDLHNLLALGKDSTLHREPVEELDLVDKGAYRWASCIYKSTFIQGDRAMVVQPIDSYRYVLSLAQLFRFPTL